MRIKKLPRLLALHLKRFKYVEQLNRYTKLSYRVLFPMELRLPNVRDDAVNNDQLYDLVAVVVHCGSTPNRGHYITLVKSHTYWLLFDDDVVDVCSLFIILLKTGILRKLTTTPLTNFLDYRRVIFKRIQRAHIFSFISHEIFYSLLDLFTQFIRENI